MVDARGLTEFGNAGVRPHRAPQPLDRFFPWEALRRCDETPASRAVVAVKRRTGETPLQDRAAGIGLFPLVGLFAVAHVDATQAVIAGGLQKKTKQRGPRRVFRELRIVNGEPVVQPSAFE